MNEKSGDLSAEAPIAERALRRQLGRVLDQYRRVGEELATKPVHDFRVALRRCRSLAEGLSSFDPHPDWRRLRKACKRFLDGLADVRDVQVMSAWVRRLQLVPAGEGTTLREMLEQDRKRARRKAWRCLDEFERKQWKQWKRRLPERAAELPLSEMHFAALALRHLNEACDLDMRCRKTGGASVCHELRVKLKRFRYSLESFLPQRHEDWKRALKRLQRLLGEVHDLDVLRGAILALARSRPIPPSTRERWLAQIAAARNLRMGRYKAVVSPRSRAQVQKNAGRGLIFDRWRLALEIVIGVTPPDGAEASGSPAKPVSRAAATRTRSRGTQRRPS